MTSHPRLLCVLFATLLTATTTACGSQQSSNASNNGGTTNAGGDVGGGSTPDAAGSDAGADAGQQVTYYQDIKPILDGRCTKCHVDGGIGGFALNTYEAAKAMSASIRQQVGTRLMPPWLAGKQCADYQHNESLSEAQIALVKSWVDQGTPEGDPNNPGQALAPVGGGLSRVDRTVKMPEAYTPQVRPDDYRCFPIPWPEDTAKYVTGLGVEPDQPQIVHHVIAYLASPGLKDAIDQKDAADDGPGYTCFGGPGVGTQSPTDPNSVTWLGVWAPGGTGHDFPAGTGIKVEPGSTVILQVHYNTLYADPVPDQSSFTVKLDDQVAHPAFFVPYTNPAWLRGDNMLIPAGTADTTHTFTFDIGSMLHRDLVIRDVGFHMHTLGDTGRLWIERADGTEDCLLDIPRWNFDWQFMYRLQTPTVLHPGDKLGIECQWDNTADNQPVVDGQQLPPRDVAWGDGTTDEMCLGLFYVTLD